MRYSSNNIAIINKNLKYQRPKSLSWTTIYEIGRTYKGKMIVQTANKNKRNHLVSIILFTLVFISNVSIATDADIKQKPLPLNTQVISQPINNTPKIKIAPPVLIPSPKEQVNVPKLDCESFANATQRLKEKGLNIKKSRYEINKRCSGKQDRVVAQKPQANTTIKKGDTVYVTLSTLPLSVKLSSKDTEVIRGEDISFNANISHKTAKLTWYLDKKPINSTGTKYTVNSQDLSLGKHTVTLEANLILQGLKPQKKVVSQSFTVIADQLVAPIIVEPPIINPQPTTVIKPITLPQSPKKITTPKHEQIKKSASKNTAGKETKTNQQPANSTTPKVDEIVIPPSSESVENIEAYNVEAYSVEDAESQAAAFQENTNKPKTTSLPTPAKKIDKDFGKILYNPPTEMVKNKTERVEVRIGRDTVDDKGLIGTGDIQIEDIPVTTTMTVKLCCGATEKDYPFDIVSLNTAETQLIEPTGYTQWAFDVTPRKSGEHYLNLSVSAHYTYANDKTRTKDIPVITRIIHVNVDKAAETKSWFINNWKWLSSSLLIPLLLWYLTYYFSQQKKQKRKFNKDIKIFISYRRDDSSGYTLAIYEQLNPTFGDENVFMDMDDIPHGLDFVEHIETRLSDAQVVLVMIGKHWLNASNDTGRRLDDPNDFVRLEVETALKRNIRVIPVLLKGASMPTAEALPDTLKSLARRNAIKIHDDQFDASIKRLIDTIGK